MEYDHRKALIGFHSFTGNDYVSTFLRKCKSVCGRTMIKSDEFVSTLYLLAKIGICLMKVRMPWRTMFANSMGLKK